VWVEGAWVVTGESDTGIKLAGAALALAGVALAQFAGVPRDPVREGMAECDQPIRWSADQDW